MNTMPLAILSINIIFNQSSTFEINYGSRYLDTYDVNNRFLMDIYQRWNTAAIHGMMSKKSRILMKILLTLIISRSWGRCGMAPIWNNEYKGCFFWSYPSGIENIKHQDRLCFYENPMEQGKPITCPFLDPSKTIPILTCLPMKGEKVYNEPCL